MGIKWTTKTNKIPDISKTLTTLGNKSVEVGALAGEARWLAGIHEYG